ncbi:alpha/beta hydrolase domain-containing protein 17C [Abeliophyllum distichum]|uniref:Alpha/beta hydrolase domain-containing protein 17C n=1 Tax=Abeliophyllum distichum TaxID=126358 RepID=A0ABD1SWE8_9LAMI
MSSMNGMPRMPHSKHRFGRFGKPKFTRSKPVDGSMRLFLHILVELKLAFFPPSPPNYKVIADEAIGLLMLDPFLHCENVDILKLPTWQGNEIVVMYIGYPGGDLYLALFTWKHSEYWADV